VVLILNDHVLKQICPGFVTGKLSDFAGVLLMSLVLHAVFEVGHQRIRKRRASQNASNRALALAVALTMLAFALPEVSPTAESAYRFTLGALQWPYHALVGLLHGRAMPRLRPVRATADATDLLALPMGLVAYRIGRRSPRIERPSKLAMPVITSLLVVALSSASASAAEPAGVHAHDGLYLGFELGPALVFVDSTASISNGFQQPIPSKATGTALPGGAIELGGTLSDFGLVLGGRVGFTRVYSPVVETLGKRFTLEEHSLGIWNAELIAELYPDPTSDLHFGAGLGLSGIDPDIQSTRSSGEGHQGWCASLEIGHGLWIGRQWTLGAVARVTAARLQGDRFGRTTLLMPGAYAALAWH
jgi:hypothetical protein